MVAGSRLVLCPVMGCSVNGTTPLCLRAENCLLMLYFDWSFQVGEVKSLSAQEKNRTRAKALEAENEKLRKEIEEWKDKLVKLEIANGIKQVTCQANYFSF